MKTSLLLVVLLSGLTACAPEQSAHLNSQIDTAQTIATKVNDNLYKAGVTASAAVGSIPQTPQDAVNTITEVGTSMVEDAKEASQQ
jgi:succinyl-CoA synthetase alpha subunit